MYAFVFAVVQCGKGDSETILIVVQADVRSVGEVLVYTFAVLWACQPVVYLQIFEEQWNFPFGTYVHRVEESQSVRTAKNQCSVGQAAGRTVVKLIAAYAVGGIVVGKFPYGAVIFAQPVLCACPYIALCIFLNARDVPAGCTLYGLDFSGGGRIVQ